MLGLPRLGYRVHRRASRCSHSPSPHPRTRDRMCQPVRRLKSDCQIQLLDFPDTTYTRKGTLSTTPKPAAQVAPNPAPLLPTARQHEISQTPFPVGSSIQGSILLVAITEFPLPRILLKTSLKFPKRCWLPEDSQVGRRNANLEKLSPLVQKKNHPNTYTHICPFTHIF